MEELPFEMLVLEHGQRPKEVQHEFVRRLYPIVFQAAHAHCRERGNSTPTEEEVGRLVYDVFTQFAPEFASGAPQSILVRFATTIRRKLSPNAFRQIADRYYAQLPVHHIGDGEQRRFLAAAYEAGLPTDVVQRLANRFSVSEQRCRTILVNANVAYAEVVKRQFDAQSLFIATEGYIQ